MSNVPYIETLKLFTITNESGKLRVQNKNVNCLFSNLTRNSFDENYNEFNRHLNVDFEPLHIKNKILTLTVKEQDEFIEKVITSWIYYYTINNLPVKVNKLDLIHPYVVDHLLPIVDKKYGKDSIESLALGAKILRQELHNYTRIVKGRRVHYNK